MTETEALLARLPHGDRDHQEAARVIREQAAYIARSVLRVEHHAIRAEAAEARVAELERQLATTGFDLSDALDRSCKNLERAIAAEAKIVIATATVSAADEIISNLQAKIATAQMKAGMAEFDNTTAADQIHDMGQSLLDLCRKHGMPAETDMCLSWLDSTLTKLATARNDALWEAHHVAFSCAEAAYVEGLGDRLAEQIDAHPGSLHDLVLRRLLYTSVEILALIDQPALEAQP